MRLDYNRVETMLVVRGRRLLSVVPFLAVRSVAVPRFQPLPPVLPFLAMLLWLAACPAFAQPPACSAAPGTPDHVEAKVDPAHKATGKTPFTPAVLTLSWKAPAADRDKPGNPPTAYVVEAGSDRGLTDVALVRTAGSELAYTIPLANGNYFVRVRAANACGTSQPSSESRVRVSDSVDKGKPNPFVIIGTVHATRERLDTRAYVRVTGQVRNGWGAAPATFVTVTASFEGVRGELGVTRTTFASGTNRRLKNSHIVTDTVIEPGATACFLVFAEFPVGTVNGLGIVATADAIDADPLKGRVDLDGPMTLKPDAFGDLLIAGHMKNTGDRPTRFNEAWIEPKDEAGQVLDCQAAPARASTVTLADGTSTRTALQPGQSGDFEHVAEAEFSAARTLRRWTTWDEDEPEKTPATTPEYLMLEKELTMLLEGDPQATSSQEIQIAREKLRAAARSIEQSLAAAGR